LIAVRDRRPTLNFAGRHTVVSVLLETDTLLIDTDQAVPHGVSEPARKSASMRTINTTMRELSQPLAHCEPIAFFCECQNPTCCATVWMTAEVFDATVADHTGWMLLPGHEPSALWHTRHLPPAPATGRTLRVVLNPNHRAPHATWKDVGVSARHRLARAS
jgi:hypothetical protein